MQVKQKQKSSIIKKNSLYTPLYTLIILQASYQYTIKDIFKISIISEKLEVTLITTINSSIHASYNLYSNNISHPYL